MNGWFHRGVGSTEHDPSVSAYHGYCRICATPWPCDAQREADRTAMARGDQSATVTALEAEVARLREALQGLFTVSRSDCNGRDCGACSTCRAIAALAPAQKDVPRG